MTKSKISLKLIISLAVAMLAICLFNTSTVKATSENIPDTLEVGITTQEGCYGGFLTDKLKEIISSKLPNVAVPHSFEQVSNSKSVLLDTSKIKVNDKIVTLKYTDANWNENDKQYVEAKLKNTNIDNENLEYDISIEDFKKFIQGQIETVINDSSIQCEYYGNLGTWHIAEGFDLDGIVNFSKNNIIYYAGWTSHKATPVVIIPSNIENTDQAFIDYALSIITSRYEYVSNPGVTLTIKKGPNTNEFIYEYKEEPEYEKVGTIILKKSTPDGYKAEDEQLIKNLVLENPKYLVINFNELKTFNSDNYDKMVLDYYNKQITDPTITLSIDCYAGGGTLFIADPSIYGGDGGPYLSIFKNNILYDVRDIGCVPYVCQITIPDTIADNETDFINYATPLISNYWKEVCSDPFFAEDSFYDEYNGNITLSKGATVDYHNINGGTTKETYNVENGYSIKGESGTILGRVILKKDDTKKDIQETDEETNIKLDANTDVLPIDTILEVIEIKAEEILNKIVETIKDISNKFVVYDITLKSNGAEIQPNGKVKISIPIPEGYDKSKLVVFRIEDGNNIEYKVSVVTIDNVEYAQFETDHFSNYLLAEKTVKEQQTPAEDNSNRVLDDEPKTGIIDMKFIVGIILVVSVIAIVRKQKKNG